jgi:hypothetical protein
MRMDGTSDELRVPSALRGRISTILAIADPFCTEHLDADYASLCRRLVAKLARQRPSPLERGDLRIWAAGAIYALGVQQLPVRPNQTPHLSADRLSELLKVRKTTMAGKAKRIRDVLDLDAQMDVEFCRLELLEDHPLAWLVEVNGMIVDARSLPAELQAGARRRELVPDIPLGEAT